jgi:hypothetical protein
VEYSPLSVSHRERIEMVQSRHQEIEMEKRKQRIFSLLKTQILGEYRRNLMAEALEKRDKLALARKWIIKAKVSEKLMMLRKNWLDGKKEFLLMVKRTVGAKKIFKRFEAVFRRRGPTCKMRSTTIIRQAFLLVASQQRHKLTRGHKCHELIRTFLRDKNAMR